MNIEITSRHFTLSGQLKELINEKVEKISKYNGGLVNCHVILTKEKNGMEECVEIIAHGKGHEFVAHDKSKFFEKSLMNVIYKLSTQIKKYHDKLIKH